MSLVHSGLISVLSYFHHNLFVWTLAVFSFQYIVLSPINWLDFNVHSSYTEGIPEADRKSKLNDITYTFYFPFPVPFHQYSIHLLVFSCRQYRYTEWLTATVWKDISRKFFISPITRVAVKMRSTPMVNSVLTSEVVDLQCENGGML